MKINKQLSLVGNLSRTAGRSSDLMRKTPENSHPGITRSNADPGTYLDPHFSVFGRFQDLIHSKNALKN